MSVRSQTFNHHHQHTWPLTHEHDQFRQLAFIKVQKQGFIALHWQRCKHSPNLLIGATPCSFLSLVGLFNLFSMQCTLSLVSLPSLNQTIFHAQLSFGMAVQSTFTLAHFGHIQLFQAFIAWVYGLHSSMPNHSLLRI